MEQINITQKLTILDRFVIPAILMKEGSYTDLAVKKAIVNKIRVTEAEEIKYQIKTLPNGSPSWPATFADEVFETTFTQIEHDMIKLAIKDLEGQKKLNDETFGIYEKFVMGKG